MSSWLIEQGERLGMRWYWAGRGWTTYRLSAIRFAREEDAANVIKYVIGREAPKARPVEYLNGEVLS